jgi:hypothetical protein
MYAHSFRSRNTTKGLPSVTFPAGYNQPFTLPDDQPLDLGRQRPEELDMGHEKHPRGLYPLVILLEAFPPEPPADGTAASPPTHRQTVPWQNACDPDGPGCALPSTLVSAAETDAPTDTAPSAPVSDTPADATTEPAPAAEPEAAGVEGATPLSVPKREATPPSKHIQSQSSFYNLTAGPNGYEAKPVAQKIMVRASHAQNPQHA